MEQERIFEPNINYRSGDWAEFRRYLAQLREDYRTALENPDQSPEKTAALRGRVGLIKELLALPKTPGLNETE